MEYIHLLFLATWLHGSKDGTMFVRLKDFPLCDYCTCFIVTHSAGLSVSPSGALVVFGPESHISTIIQWIAINLGIDIQVLQRMNLNEFSISCLLSSTTSR